jgi:hypothetical protein
MTQTRKHVRHRVLERRILLFGVAFAFVHCLRRREERRPRMMVGYDELKAMGIDVSPYNIRRRAREGRFPKPVSGSRRPGDPFKWDKKDVLAWLKARKPSTRG